LRATTALRIFVATALLGAFVAAGPAARAADVSDDDLLQQAYDQKFANPNYVTWMSRPGLPTGHQDFDEEKLIKSIRARIAKHLKAPPEAEIIKIPVIAGSPPLVDGRLDYPEWLAATKVAMESPHTRTKLLLLSDGSRLYLGADVPDERTRHGFDQFRFYLHVLGSKLIVNERLHVGTDTYNSGGIRETHVRWRGAPARNDDERWKNFGISDWQIYRQARGRSYFGDYRQYEAVLDLAEAGLPIGVPFPVFVEVETDANYRPDGKFGSREYLGMLGSQNAPVWFVIDPTLSAGPKHDAGVAREESAAGSQKVHKWTDDAGRVHFGDRPPR
jgi:hypothetical protein